MKKFSQHTQKTRKVPPTPFKTKGVSSDSRSERGFTVLEALIAVSILSLAIAGAFGVAQSSLSASYLVRDEAVARHLAQEGIERIRNVRDNNRLETLNSGLAVDWLSGLSACMDENFCRINLDPDTASQTIEACQLSGCDDALYLTDSGHYVYTSAGNTVTRYTRWIQVKETFSDREAKVTVGVKYTKGGNAREVITEEYIYRWYYY